MHGSVSYRVRMLTLAVLALTAVGIVAWSRSTLIAGAIPAGPIAATVVSGGVSGGAAADTDPAPKIYLTPPVTAEAAATWVKLQKRIAMPFSNETPLEDVLKYIKSATAPPADAKGGDANKPAPTEAATSSAELQIYVDPVGLQEAEKTVSSPITIHLEGVPLATSLELVLRQLGLAYYVQSDGILVIDSKGSERHLTSDPFALVLDNLAKLRAEVAALKTELSMFRGGAHAGPANAQQTPQAAMGGMMGGFR